MGSSASTNNESEDPSSATSPQQDDDDEDNLSIVSTAVGDNDEEKEWEVDDILAERPHPDEPGASQYLIKWDGYPLEDCTWEPVEHLKEVLLDMWEQNKTEVAAGSRQVFDLATLEAACAARAQRHIRRNAKRRRLGLPLTPPFPPGYLDDTSNISPVDQDSSSSSEDEGEVDEFDPATISSPISSPKTKSTMSTPAPSTTQKPPSTSTRVPKQKIFTGVPSPTHAAPKEKGKSKVVEKDGRQKVPSLPSKPAVTAPGSRITAAAPIRKSNSGTMTGYQGTARRSSVFKSNLTKTSAQSVTDTTNKPVSTTARIASTSLSKPSNEAKRLTATRTRPLPASSAATNIFAGGKQRKKRTNLAESMADPTKAPKAFSNMRMQNLARKRGIEKGDAAGSLASIPSAFIIDNDQTKPRKSSLVSPSTVSPKDQETFNMPITPSEGVHEPQSGDEGRHQRDVVEERPPKRTRSVRFAGEDNEELAHTMNELFGSPPTNGDPIAPDQEKPADTRKTGQGPSRKVSLASYQERGVTQTVEKLVGFGKGEAIMTSFSGIPRQTTTWLSAFRAEEILWFVSTCTSFHFSSKKDQLIKETLAVGEIKSVSTEDARALQNVAESLRRGSCGLHLIVPEYSILVYPAHCEDWSWLSDKECKSDALLQHIIFQSTIPSHAYSLELHKESIATKLGGETELKLIEALAKLDFTKLSPQSEALVDKQSYMLLLPLKAQQLQGAVTAWLRSHQPGRPIFAVDQQNGWHSFHEAVQAGGGGTIISHAKFTLWELEKIRGLWRMLEDQKYTFWHMDTGEYERPQYPSNLEAVSVPGTIRLTRLFPYGRAFLITPSFVITEPVKLCAFLKWFLNYGANPNHLLVACHDFPRFLRHIAEEKIAELNTLKKMNPGNEHADIFLESARRSGRHIEDHVRALQLLQQIMDTFGDEETNEDVRKIHWLSELIDPSDEQSLVNAFCWWTQLKCDRFRRFFVLGSDRKNMPGAYRYIEIPRYFDTESSNPDVANILLQRRSLERELRGEVYGRGDGSNIAWPTDVFGGRKSICEPSFQIPSPKRLDLPAREKCQMLLSDDAHEIQRWIDIHRRNTQVNWSELHDKPVSWKDQNMAEQFDDGDSYKSCFDTFSSWFKAAPRFSKRRNTWYGLFYTIDETWDEFMPKYKYKRHPWIGIYRPKNPHLLSKGPFAKIELFIWDLAATNREKTEHPLLDMQCQLVNYVHDSVEELYPGCFLSDVWYSSATAPQIGQNEDPLNITRRMIEDMFEYGREWLPPHEKLLVNRWTLLDPRFWTNGMSPATLRPLNLKPSELTANRIPQTKGDKNKLKRMIWHPPHRGGRRSTKCLNQLYEACLKARLRDPECDQIQHWYRPTQEWWADQVEEGRGYGYVCVEAGAKIIERLTKGKPHEKKLH
ncbi:hypothetical protein F5Y08DRAFT_136618 [Xylaria arbuscula]|nr:hypothetical protein F5Y08DRAFT_136618 [Xylaria arbuscula]